MRAFDIIQKKKLGLELTNLEIEFVVSGFTGGSIPDFQMSALLMAICLKGLTKRETTNLTQSMAYSGDTVNLSEISGIKVDKHSTGGVGDKTTLIISPIVASFGVPIAKMSGRGLGHTGGTVDKLESIPGMKTSFSTDEFISIVKKTGICVAGQSGNMAPADKKIYALRDVTATIDSIPLIAASIMSKKIAAGSDAILLDVKTGSGAFMKTVDDSILLAELMVEIGEEVGRKTVALITNMNIPLGNKIGNSLEIIECVETLKGKGPQDLLEVCLELASEMLILGGIAGDTKAMALESVNNGKAFEKLCEMAEAQGGDSSFLRDTTKFEKAKYICEIKVEKEGYISSMNVEAIGVASVMLGAGRDSVGDSIDFSAGIELLKKTGDYIKQNDTVAVFYSSSEERIKFAAKRFIDGVEVSPFMPEKEALIYKSIRLSD